MGMSSACLTVVRTLASSVAPQSSSLGMETDLTGATLVFAMTILLVGERFGYVALTYTTAAYAASEASLKP